MLLTGALLWELCSFAASFPSCDHPFSFGFVSSYSRAITRERLVSAKLLVWVRTYCVTFTHDGTLINTVFKIVCGSANC